MTAGADTTLHVVLLNWNSAEQTLGCLQRIAQWAGLSPEVHVVDNGSTDGSARLIAEAYPGATIHANPGNLGYAGGSNTALRSLLAGAGLDDHQQSSTVLLLNTDAAIAEKDMEVLLGVLREDSAIGVTGPLIFSGEASERLLSAGGRDPMIHPRTYWNDREGRILANGDMPYEVDYVSGTVALLRTEVLHRVGLFDEEYFFSCEMADLCARIKQAGYRCVVAPKARAWHDMAQSGQLRQTLYLYYSLRNRYLLLRKFRNNDLTLRARWTFIGFRGMLKALARGNLSSARAQVLACSHGLQGRFGNQNRLFIRDSTP